MDYEDIVYDDHAKKHMTIQYFQYNKNIDNLEALVPFNSTSCPGEYEKMICPDMRSNKDNSTEPIRLLNQHHGNPEPKT